MMIMMPSDFEILQKYIKNLEEENGRLREALDAVVRSDDDWYKTACKVLNELEEVRGEVTDE